MKSDPPAPEVVGAPSTLPAFPSVPGLAALQRRDPLERLEELSELHHSGALTDAEFASQRAGILAEG